jgi:hypothetical protein
MLLLLLLISDGKRPEKLNLWVSKHGMQSGCDGRMPVKGSIGWFQRCGWNGTINGIGG